MFHRCWKHATLSYCNLYIINCLTTGVFLLIFYLLVFNKIAIKTTVLINRSAAFYWSFESCNLGSLSGRVRTTCNAIISIKQPASYFPRACHHKNVCCYNVDNEQATCIDALNIADYNLNHNVHCTSKWRLSRSKCEVYDSRQISPVLLNIIWNV